MAMNSETVGYKRIGETFGFDPRTHKYNTTAPNKNRMLSLGKWKTKEQTYRHIQIWHGRVGEPVISPS
jgi:hypothetical protein